jgi:hypothetical protein
VQGEDVEVVTDHHSLIWLMDNSLMRGRLARWVWTIQNIPVTILHRAGETMVVADALSRDVLPPPSCSHFHEQLKSLVESPALPTAAEMKNEVSEEQLRLSKDAASESGWSLNETIPDARWHSDVRPQAFAQNDSEPLSR